jgi:CBS domain containing-hemolysin-like protein
MVALPVTTPLDDAVSAALDSGHSRLPVFEENSDNIVGIFYVRDVLQYWNVRREEQAPSLTSLLRSAFFVPETKKVNELLEEFRASKVQLAVIVDEYGGTAGIATMEDLLEEIVGEIQDEYDTEQQEEWRQIDQNTFELDAGIPVDDVNDILGVHLPEEEDFDTLGGYIMYKLGHLPSEGETLEEKEFDISILKVTERRIDQVKLVRHIEPTEQEDD